MKKIISVFLTIIVIILTAFSTPGTMIVQAASPLKISIFGDSISNFSGYAPSDFNTAFPMDGNDVNSVEQTWWMQTITALGDTYLADDAASGSRVTPSGQDETGKWNFNDPLRISALLGSDGSAPDVVLIMGGTNDCTESVSVSDFRTAYDTLLKTLKADSRFSKTIFVCLTIIPRYDKNWNTNEYPVYTNQNGNTYADYNTAINDVAAANSFPVIDTASCGIAADPQSCSYDGVHPTAAGMKCIADTVTAQLKVLLTDDAVSAAQSSSDPTASIYNSQKKTSSAETTAVSSVLSAEHIFKSIDRAAAAANRKDRDTTFCSGKYSLMGDSISTFEETMPSGYANQYPYGDITNVGQTWWHIAFDALGYTICVNDSAAGSRVCGDVLETGDKPCFISNRRIMDITSESGEVPGLIVIFGGTNDHCQHQPLEDFRTAYRTLLRKLKAYYPDSEIVCMTCIAHTDKNSDGEYYDGFKNQEGLYITSYNEVIEEVAAEADISVPVIDAHACGLNSSNAAEYTIDGLHPNAAGAELVAQYVINHFPYSNDSTSADQSSADVTSETAEDTAGTT